MSGWKTIIAGAGFVVFGIGLIVYGETQTGVETILVGISIMAGRLAIEKAIKK